MTATGHTRGHPIYYDGHAWRYRDTDELEAENARLREAGGQLRAYFDTERIHYESCIREMCERWDATAKESD